MGEMIFLFVAGIGLSMLGGMLLGGGLEYKWRGEILLSGIAILMGLCLLAVITFVEGPVKIPSGLPSRALIGNQEQVQIVGEADNKISIIVIETIEGKTIKTFYRVPKEALNLPVSVPEIPIYKVTTIEVNGYRRLIIE